MLRRIFGPKRNGVIGEWRKSHNKGLHDLYPLPSRIRIPKSRWMSWVWGSKWGRRGTHIDYW
jgi:hypothetical protein